MRYELTYIHSIMRTSRPYHHTIVTIWVSYGFIKNTWHPTKSGKTTGSDITSAQSVSEVRLTDWLDVLLLNKSTQSCSRLNLFVSFPPSPRRHLHNYCPLSISPSPRTIHKRHNEAELDPQIQKQDVKVLTSGLLKLEFSPKRKLCNAHIKRKEGDPK